MSAPLNNKCSAVADFSGASGRRAVDFYKQLLLTYRDAGAYCRGAFSPGAGTGLLLLLLGDTNISHAFEPLSRALSGRYRVNLTLSLTHNECWFASGHE